MAKEVVKVWKMTARRRFKTTPASSEIVNEKYFCPWCADTFHIDTPERMVPHLQKCEGGIFFNEFEQVAIKVEILEAEDDV
jgi:hypothetical protein